MECCQPLVGRDFSEFAIPCLPNFTVIPKNKSGVTIDKKMCLTDDNTAQLSEEKEDIMRLWIEGVYIGAAYVAAGFCAATQCSEYIKDHFKKLKVDSELPGVRYDVEAGNNSLCTATNYAERNNRFYKYYQRRILTEGILDGYLPQKMLKCWSEWKKY